ncbi:MAG: hypothetical protein B0A82_19805 [Alkalinema sp. CACIAM 70d]|nr:MAG: hypothetical protein B0A82_19805 [Alkalinema sp. CACIAM 70d]
MIDTLVQAYSPLILWVGLGLLIWRWLPKDLSHWLGRGLYWFGVPWQIFDLARHSQLSGDIGLAPVITIATLGSGLVMAWLTLQILERLPEKVTEDAPFWQQWVVQLPRFASAEYGSFIIAAMLGNTGFVGLGLLPAIINPQDYSWAVFFSLTQNLIGTYGIGVLIASYYGQSHSDHSPWTLLRDLLTVPSLWAFALGYSTRSVEFPGPIELFSQSSLLFVVPASFLLMGIRLGLLEGWSSLRNALVPVILKIILLPGLVGIGTSLLGLSGDARLALVLMSGMPSAFASLILAEEYDMDRDLAASSIAISTIGLLLMIPVWLWIF